MHKYRSAGRGRLPVYMNIHGCMFTGIYYWNIHFHHIFWLTSQYSVGVLYFMQKHWIFWASKHRAQLRINRQVLLSAFYFLWDSEHRPSSLFAYCETCCEKIPATLIQNSRQLFSFFFFFMCDIVSGPPGDCEEQWLPQSLLMRIRLDK